MSDHGPCGGACGRRSFLRGSATLVALTALIGRDAMAMPVRTISALARRGTAITYPIPPSDGVTIDRDQDVILARVQGQVFAFSLTCPHQNTALRWQDGAKAFTCPKHKSKYQPDGVFVSGRATRAMDRFAIARSGDSVVVDVDRLYRADEQPAEWKAAVVLL